MREGAGGAEGGIFAERVAGDIGGMIGEADALGFEHADDGDADRHQGRLGVFGQAQDIVRAFEHDGRETLAQGLVDFLEHGAGLGIGRGQILAHADGLAALPGKGECMLVMMAPSMHLS